MPRQTRVSKEEMRIIIRALNALVGDQKAPYRMGWHPIMDERAKEMGLVKSARGGGQ